MASKGHRVRHEEQPDRQERSVIGLTNGSVPVASKAELLAAAPTSPSRQNGALTGIQQLQCRYKKCRSKIENGNKDVKQRREWIRIIDARLKWLAAEEANMRLQASAASLCGAYDELARLGGELQNQFSRPTQQMTQLFYGDLDKAVMDQLGADARDKDIQKVLRGSYSLANSARKRYEEQLDSAIAQRTRS